jgi:hypothetical protein
MPAFSNHEALMLPRPNVGHQKPLSNLVRQKGVAPISSASWSHSSAIDAIGRVSTRMSTPGLGYSAVN